MKIYSLLYRDTLTGTVRNALVKAETFEEAHEIGANTLAMNEPNHQSWFMEKYISLNIDDILKKDEVKPVLGIVSKKFLDELNKEKVDQPIETYIMNLKLAKDKFASTQGEKRVLTSLINKITKKYGK